MKKKDNLSIKEVAKLSGVSVATVSRVINNNGRFSEETRKKVLSVIQEYNYTTNMAAKSLRISKSKTIGIIVPNINNTFFSELVLEIEKFFFENSYSVFICNTNQDKNKEIDYIKSLDSKLVDGIICISSISVNPMNYIKRNIPIVYINNSDFDNSFCIECDHYMGGFLATEHLLKKGCKNIVLLTNNRDASAVNHKVKGFEDAMQKHNIPILPELILKLELVEGVFEDCQKAIYNLIKNNTKFDGIFATNDLRAHSALVTLQQNNINVPDKVKIIGYDDSYVSKYSNPPITTILQNKKILALKASNLLLNLMTDKNINSDKKIIIPTELIERKTT
ncbi:MULTISPECIES: LacI family DNA-binding transcriptional regulator [unclassified Romboutsia]|uniref:LacI family DNA-binding transcriptional regulator n=1 Tax=unclassified Romboutsia TaxID=2626894 RepID=UPI000822FA38|nr:MULTISPECIES: LacI family DNA-binding transcriptional regulator [unclassified Romboutsia]SCI25896.1 Degradation activator [uncultured Clostridium sp.]